MARLREPFTLFPGNAHINDYDAADQFGRISAVELGHIGVNMNFAPVMDVALLCENSIMKDRSFPGSPQNVARLGCRVIEGLQAGGIMAVAKHFPGIGRTVLDSHLALPDLDVDARALTDVDLVPFSAAIHGNVAGIMLSHIRYTAIDPVWPASLSPAVTADLLRRKMGYQGVVMTDDLDMGAIKPNHDINTAIDQILSADVDIALICHKGPDIQAACEKIRKRLTDSHGLRQMGRQSVERVLRLKRGYLKGNWEEKYTMSADR